MLENYIYMFSHRFVCGNIWNNLEFSEVSMTCTFCVRMFWKCNIGKELFTNMTCTFCVVEMQECYVTSRSFIVTRPLEGLVLVNMFYK